jgi:Dolichyl-phosphate-mannose-protein mannosyltransferase
MAKSRDRAWLAAILLLGSGLRLYGLGHSLPFVYNPDEANIMARALSVARGLDPEYYLYPSFFFYLLFGVMGVLFVVGRLVGRYESLAAFQARFFQDPTDFYLAGRITSVVFALATLVLLERLASKHFGKTAGRAAALFAAVAYFHVRDSHYLKHDVPAGFLVVLALWSIDRAMDRKTTASIVAAGATMGVSFATHYYMIFLAPAFVLCHLAHRGWRDLSRIALAGGVSAATFFLLSPFVILRFGTALEHMRANRQVVVDRSLSQGATLFPSLGSYLSFLLEQGFGYLLCGLTVLGLVLLIRRGSRELVLWVSFPLFFFAFITYTFFAGRYLNPILPSLAAMAGLAVAAVETRFGTRVAGVVTVAAILQPLYLDFQVDRLFGRPDTRTLARAYLLDHVDSGTTMALQSYSVPVPQSASSFRESLEANGALSELDRRGKYASLLEVAEAEPEAYRLFFLGKGDEYNRIYVGYEELVSGLDPLRERSVSVVVLREAPVAPPSDVTSLFDRVKREGRLLEEVSPFSGSSASSLAPYLDNEDWPPSSELVYKGPRIRIWSLEER